MAPPVDATPCAEDVASANLDEASEIFDEATDANDDALDVIAAMG
jgi:hypothetical protein